MPLTPKTVWLLLAGVVSAAVLAVLLFPLGNIGAGMVDDVMNRRPTRPELLGSYQLIAPWGNVTLRLNADNTFTESIAENNQATRLLNGTWGEMDEGNCASLQLRPFAMIWDEDHHTETRLFGLCFHRRRWGSTYGMVDPDLGETLEPL